LAYPLAQCPTFKELKDILEKKYGCQYKKGNAIKNNKPCAIFYFERVIDGSVMQCSIDSYDDEERIVFPVIRSVCRRLKINPSIFGLTLG